MNIEDLDILLQQAEDQMNVPVRVSGSKLKGNGTYLMNQQVIAAMNKDALSAVRDLFYQAGVDLAEHYKLLQADAHSQDTANAIYFLLHVLDENITGAQKYAIRRFNAQLAEAIDMVRRVCTQKPSDRIAVSNSLYDLTDILLTIVAEGSLG